MVRSSYRHPSWARSAIYWSPASARTTEVAFLKSFRGDGFQIAQLENDDIPRLTELVETYVDLPLGLVDAAVITIAERLGLAEIATIDRRHFTVVRPRNIPAFTLLPD